MPTYSYACKDCGYQFDIVQAFKDDSLTECPQCSGNLRKLFNSVGIVFKGSGFYRNDSRSGSGTSSSSTSAKPDTGTSGSSTPASSGKDSGSSSTSDSGSSGSSSPSSGSGDSGSKLPAASSSGT